MGLGSQLVLAMTAIKIPLAFAIIKAIKVTRGDKGKLSVIKIGIDELYLYDKYKLKCKIISLYHLIKRSYFNKLT